jgi:hypothetical protein
LPASEGASFWQVRAGASPLAAWICIDRHPLVRARDLLPEALRRAFFRVGMTDQPQPRERRS